MRLFSTQSVRIEILLPPKMKKSRCLRFTSLMYAQQQLQIPQVQPRLPFLEQQQQQQADTSDGNIISDK